MGTSVDKSGIKYEDGLPMFTRICQEKAWRSIQEECPTSSEISLR